MSSVNVERLDVERLALLNLFDELRDAGPDPALWRSRCAHGLRSLLAADELLFIDVVIQDSRPQVAWLSQDPLKNPHSVLVTARDPLEGNGMVSSNGKPASGRSSRRSMGSTPGDRRIPDSDGQRPSRDSKVPSSDSRVPSSDSRVPGRDGQAHSSNGREALVLHPVLEDFIQGIDSRLTSNDSAALATIPSQLLVERMLVRQCQLLANHRRAKNAIFQALPAAHLANHWLVLAYSTQRMLRNPLGSRRVKNGLALLAKISESLGRSLATHEHPSPSRLPPRCREVLYLILLGHSDHEIGQQLNMAHDTVRGHVRNIFRIFNVNTRSRLMARWIEFAQSRPVNTRSNL